MKGTPFNIASAANYWAYFNNLKRTGVLILTSSKPTAACLLLLQIQNLWTKARTPDPGELTQYSCGGHGQWRKRASPRAWAPGEPCVMVRSWNAQIWPPSFWRTAEGSPYVQRMWVWVFGIPSPLSGFDHGAVCTHRAALTGETLRETPSPGQEAVGKWPWKLGSRGQEWETDGEPMILGVTPAHTDAKLCSSGSSKTDGSQTKLQAACAGRVRRKLNWHPLKARRQLQS